MSATLALLFAIYVALAIWLYAGGLRDASEHEGGMPLPPNREGE